MRYFAAFGILALLVGGAAWVLYPEKEERTPSATSAGVAIGVKTREIPQGWKEYRNVSYNFSVLHPDALSVHEYEEGEGAMTIIFEDAKSAQGFQIFIVPYSAPQVSEERFKRDIPSGVRKDQKDVTIDGATASSFYSMNLALGETAEVWFIHGGYLYEVTTLKSLDTWLSSIMQTWQFI